MSDTRNRATFVDRALDVTVGILLSAGLLLYVAAKLHFYTRFDPQDLGGYAAGHWPYSAGLALIAISLSMVVYLSRRNAKRVLPQEGSPTKR